MTAARPNPLSGVIASGSVAAVAFIAHVTQLVESNEAASRHENTRASCERAGSSPAVGASFNGRNRAGRCGRDRHSWQDAARQTDGQRSGWPAEMQAPQGTREIDTRPSTFNAADARKSLAHIAAARKTLTAGYGERGAGCSARPAAPTPGAIGTFFPVAFFARSQGRAFFSLVHARLVEQFPALVQQLGVKPGRKVAA